MFDLVDILKKGTPSHEVVKESITSVLFYQTEQCRELVLEAYRFEGVAPPEVLTNSDLSISDHVRQQSIEVVIVELNKSENVTEDAERISHLLPSHASVIVIGSEDAISTIRNLKDMGFYYVFWPIPKEELIDFVKSVHNNRQWNRGPGQKRRAKRVAVIGAKGGVGCSLVTSEIAHQLVDDKHSTCVVVDHNYSAGNIDIMMGVTKFEKRQVPSGALLTGLDLSTAKAMLAKQSDALSILALSSSDLKLDEMEEYTESVTELISSDVNFVIDDLSASSVNPYKTAINWLDCDCAILIFTPTISSVRDAARLKKRFSQLPEDKRPRFIAVLNHTQPEKFSNVPTADIEKYLEHKIDVVIPFSGKAASELVEGKRLVKADNKLSAPLKKLTSLLLGEKTNLKSKKSLFSFSRARSK